MERRKRIALVLLTVAGCVACDQRTKSLASEHLKGRDGVSLLADTIRLDYSENAGAFLSLGASLPDTWRTAIFTVGALAGLAAVLLYAMLSAHPPLAQVAALALICGGGFGNVTDRLINGGYVRDFLNVGVGPVRTGIFNLADVALMSGCLLMLALELRSAASSRRRNR